jgi:hypothetical protein
MDSSTGNPPCGWLEGDEECGEESIATIRVRNKITQAVIHVCRRHKALHDEQYARQRKTPASH